MRVKANLEAILFDLDGTLADSTEDIYAALCLALGDVGIRATSSLRHLVDGSPLEEIFASAAPGSDGELYVQFVKNYRGHYQRLMHTNTSLFPGVRETLEVLRSLDPRVSLAVATAKRTDVAEQLLAGLDATHFFDLIAGSSGTSLAPKPSPALLLDVCNRLQVNPSAALMVGDTLRDLEAGRSAGMKTAAVTFGMGDADALLAWRPDFVIEEFDELLVVLGLDS
ncbi:MAG: HAD family hydrolase [Deltaproteobacteria bacterium]|nr:HAD family hydrolase [Deltaproteobacteria bacterium]